MRCDHRVTGGSEKRVLKLFCEEAMVSIYCSGSQDECKNLELSILRCLAGLTYP